MPQPASKKILIVPLDWGLGHTTRCIPVIRALLALHCEVQLGGTESTNALLKKEFPALQYHSYPSYNISYPEKGSAFLRHLMLQMPRVAGIIKQEQKKTHHLNEQYGYDMIISDNRFGVWNKASTNIFITHQLNVVVPQSKLLERLTNWLNHRYINRFNNIIVPDWAGSVLSGALSNTRGIRVPLTFVGNLSRWEFSNSLQENKKGIVAILSGPEPQRTLLENMLVQQYDVSMGKMTIVRAKPNEQLVPKHHNIDFINHLTATDLQNLAERSHIIISRAGYSTIMDLVAIQHRAILIPTPGQTEQEYLAVRLHKQGLFIFYEQARFDLQQALHDYALTKWNKFPEGKNILQENLKDLLAI